MKSRIYDRLVNIEDALGELLVDVTDEGHTIILQFAKQKIAYVLDDMDQRQESRGK